MNIIFSYKYNYKCGNCSYEFKNLYTMRNGFLKIIKYKS